MASRLRPKTYTVDRSPRLRAMVMELLRTGRPARRSGPRPTPAPRLRAPRYLDERPTEVDDRKVPGHGEGDLVIGKGGTYTVVTLVNALPETVTAVAAVRRGALALAVAAILGGNCLDALNLVIGDVAFRNGSLYHAVGADELFVTAAGLFMTAVVLSSMLVRQSCGHAGAPVLRLGPPRLRRGPADGQLRRHRRRPGHLSYFDTDPRAAGSAASERRTMTNS